jgi:hypothetical protein
MAQVNEVTATIDEKYSEYAPFVERLTNLYNERIGLEAKRQQIDEALLTNAFDIGACLTETKAFAAKAQKAVPADGDVAHALTAYEEFKKIAEVLGYGESTANKYIAIHESYRLQDLRQQGCLHGEAFTTLYVLSLLDETSLAEMQKAGSLLSSNTRPVTRSHAESFLKTQKERIGAEIDEENRQREANDAKASEIAASAAATEEGNAQAPTTTGIDSVTITPTMTEVKDPSPIATTYFRFVLPELEPDVAAAVEKAIAVLRGDLPELQGYTWEITLKPIAAATKAA